MAFIQTQTNSFKVELYSGVHAFGNTYRVPDTFKLALYTLNAQLDATTTIYSSTNEVVDPNYTAGGQVLTIVAPASGNANMLGSVAYLNFAPVTWTPATFSATGGLIYNSTQGNRSVAVLFFGNNITAQNNKFIVNFPLTGPTTALIRSI